VGDGVPHPTGSAANEAIRVRIVDELAKLGYQPGVQTAFACSEYGTCARVKNVLARLNGTEAGPAVLLAAHYDSVPAGPGASDDGQGTAAVLEIARALRSLPPPRNPIIILITDGEEDGSLGARAFVDLHPWAQHVRAAVNIDTRGTSGPSLMFETGSANAWAVRLYAAHVAHPATSSISYAVYKMLPNDTDFTVFKAAGYQGFNFANIGDVVHYHTPLDNFENASSATLQHHGDNALSTLLALANTDLRNFALDSTLGTDELARSSKHEAVFFDVFGHWTIWWHAGRTLVLAALVAVLLILQIGWLVHNKRLTLQQFSYGLLEWLVVIGVTGTSALLLQWLLRFLGAMPVNWVAHPLPLVAAFWSLALAVVAIQGDVFGNRAGFWGLWAGVWTWWALLSLFVAWQASEFSYVLLIPSGVAALVGLPFTLWRGERVPGAGLAAILPLAAAGIVGFAPLLLLYAGIGGRVLATIALLVGLILTPLAPLCADLRTARGLPSLALVWIPVVGSALAAFAAVVVPVYSAKVPERVNIEFWQNADSGKSQWIVYAASDRLPEPIRLTTAFRHEEKGPFQWDTESAFVADAPHVGLAAPTFTILESSQVGGRRAYRTLLRSERGAPEAMALFPPDADVESVRVEGEPVALASERVRRFLGGWSAYDCVTMPAKGVEVSFTLPTGRPVEVYALDRTFELPPEGMFLLKSRPLTATPSQNGDVALVSRRVQLIP
jgi:hypothetical protein